MWGAVGLSAPRKTCLAWRPASMEAASMECENRAAVEDGRLMSACTVGGGGGV